MSYAATTTLAPDNGTDTTFRAWGLGISSRIALMGWVQTSDTGQINWSTVTTPAATNTSQGYEIWRMDDALQGTAPCFLKLEYGSGGSALRPSLWWTVGTGSNGSGTLTGQVNARTQVSAGLNSTVAQTCVFSGATNRLGICMFTPLASAAFALFIERSKANDGSDNNIAILLTTFNAINVRWQQRVTMSGGVPAAIADTNIVAPVALTTTGAIGVDIGVYAHSHSKTGAYVNAGIAMVAYFSADITQDSTFSLSIYGVTRTYYAVGGGGASINTISRGNTQTNLRIAMLYE